MTTRAYIRPRAFDRKVYFDVATSGKGVSGGLTNTWTPLFDGAGLWASIVSKSGGRRDLTSAAGGEVSVGTHEISVRYNPLIVPITVRVRHGGVVYSILSADNKFDQGDLLVLTCEAGAAANG